MNNEMFNEMGPGTPPTMPGPISSPSFGPRPQMPGGGPIPGGPGPMPGGGPGPMSGVGPGPMPGGGMPGGPGGMPGGGPGPMPPFNMMNTRGPMPGGHMPGPNMMPNMPGPPGPMSSGPNNKVYPPNQPMIFNNSNPNAPPIYPCGICHKEVHDNDQAILCESGCNFWFHRSCTGLTEPAYTMLTQEVYAEWVCDRCYGSNNMVMVKLKP